MPRTLLCEAILLNTYIKIYYYSQSAEAIPIIVSRKSRATLTHVRADTVFNQTNKYIYIWESLCTDWYW